MPRVLDPLTGRPPLDGRAFLTPADPPVTGLFLLSWAGALLATLVVWPWRAWTGRWPVVAYVLYRPDLNIEPVEVEVRGRAEADALVKRWVEQVRAGDRNLIAP